MANNNGRARRGSSSKSKKASSSASKKASTAASKKMASTTAATKKTATAVAGTAAATRTTTTTTTRSATGAASRRVGGRTAYLPPNRSGKFPWRLRWLGLLPIAALFAFGSWWAWDHMEDGLDERAAIHLACEGIDAESLDLDWSYRDVTVEGQLPVGVSPERVEQIIDEGSDDGACLEDQGLDAGSDPGVYDVNIAGLAAAAPLVAVPDPEPTATPVPTTTPVPDPTATPVPEPTATAAPEPTATAVPDPTAVPIAVALDTSGGFDGRVLTLSGVVASEAQRDSLVAAAVAAVGEGNVTDELVIDSDRVADGNDALVGDLASIVGRFGDELIQGSAELSDGELTYDLLAASPDVAAALELPGTGTLDSLEPPPPSFTG